MLPARGGLSHGGTPFPLCGSRECFPIILWLRLWFVLSEPLTELCGTADETNSINTAGPQSQALLSYRQRCWGGGNLVYSPRTAVCWVILIDCPLLYRISKVLSVPFSFNDLIRDPRRP